MEPASTIQNAIALRMNSHLDLGKIDTWITDQTKSTDEELKNTFKLIKADATKFADINPGKMIVDDY